MNRLVIPFLIAALICLTSGCRSAPPQSIARAPTELSMRLRGTEPAVDVFVNGRGPFLFAIDTGGTDLARADSSLVERLQLRKTGIDFTNDASGRNVKTFSTVNLSMLTIGGIEFHNVEASTRDFNRNPSLPPVDGILTFDLFADYLLTLDYPRQRVRIEKGELAAPDGAEILPLKRISGLPAVEITIAGRRVVAEIDSGNVGTAFLFPESLIKTLRFSAAPVPAGQARTVSNVVDLQEAPLDGDVNVGKHAFQNPAVTYPAPFDFPNVGSPALREFTITFDQRNNRVRFLRWDDISDQPR